MISDWISSIQERADFKQNAKYWFIGAVFVTILLSLFFNDHFNQTRKHKKALSRGEQELARLAAEVNAMEKKVAELQSNPHTYESLVRKELGYLRPGEREVRFIDSKD